MFIYISLFIILTYVIILAFIYQRTKYILEKHGKSNENAEYVYPEIISNFITDKKGKEIIEYVSTSFLPSGVVAKNVYGGSIDEKSRDSKNSWIPKENSIVKDMIQNICMKHNLKFENAEDVQVVKYDKDNFYKPHHDSFNDMSSKQLSSGGHRVLTCLIYLNDNFDGGETIFPNLDLTIKPVKNSAVVFRPLDAENKKCHPKALHGGALVISGTKYVCNIWIRENKFNYENNTLFFDNIIDSFI